MRGAKLKTVNIAMLIVSRGKTLFSTYLWFSVFCTTPFRRYITDQQQQQERAVVKDATGTVCVCTVQTSMDDIKNTENNSRYISHAVILVLSVTNSLNDSFDRN